MKLPQTPSFNLEGKTALVTGASSGIGLACATALGLAGAHVVCAARSAGKLGALAQAMRTQGLSAEKLKLDITDIKATALAIAALPKLDIYVNSAGLARHGPALDTEDADFDEVSKINWKAAYFSAREAASKMIAGGKGGSIITISSQMAHVGGIDRAVYCGTKHAVEGMTKAMAIEWGKHGIRINTICPTFIKTPLTQSTFEDPERVAWIKSKIKLGRIGEVEDIMGPVVFLASDASALITGASILVDGWLDRRIGNLHELERLFTTLEGVSRLHNRNYQRYLGRQGHWCSKPLLFLRYSGAHAHGCAARQSSSDCFNHGNSS